MKKYLLASLLFFSTLAHADTQLYPCFTTTANLLTCLISNYSIVWPPHQGANGTALINDGSGNLTWSTQPAGTVTSVHGTAPVTVTSPTTAPVVSMAKATGFVDGYLGSSDWTTFNAKAPAFAAGNLTETGSSVLTIGGGLGAVIGAGTTINVARADTATNGYIASSDWVTFNNKVSTSETVNTSAPLTGGGDLSAPRTIAIPAATGSVNGYLGSSDWTLFNAKVPTSEAISTTAPLLGGGDLSAPRTFSMTQAATAANGYLSSTDWNTFNSSAASSVPSSRNVNTSAPLTGGGDLSADRTIGIPQAATAADGYLGSSDWNTFNTKVSTSESISTTAPLQGGGNLSAPRTFSITQSATAADGYLSSTDWNTFNAKQPAGSYALQATAINTSAPLAGGGNLSTTRTLSITQSATAADGYLNSTDWNTFNTKVPTSETINTTAPLQGGGDLSATRTLSMTQSATAANGYLSSTDWNTFNGKQATISVSAPITLSTSTVGITQSATAANGYLSSTDWNTFNGKASATLSNLGTTAINADLTPSADGTLGLGSNSKNWLDVLTYQLDLDANAAGTQKLSMTRATGGSNYSLTYPNAQGGASSHLQNNGSGVLSWVTDFANPLTTTGDIVYASNTATPATPARLGVGGANTVLHGGASIPAYSAVASADFTGQLSAAKGGTGADLSGATGAVFVSSGAFSSVTIDTAWTTYTPTVSNGCSNGSPVTSARYIHTNPKIVRFELIISCTGAANLFSVSIPVTADYAGQTQVLVGNVSSSYTGAATGFLPIIVSGDMTHVYVSNTSATQTRLNGSAFTTTTSTVTMFFDVAI